MKKLVLAIALMLGAMLATESEVKAKPVGNDLFDKSENRTSTIIPPRIPTVPK